MVWLSLVLWLLISNVSIAGWRWINPTTNIHNIHGIKFYDNSNGVVYGEKGKILRTTNGGLSWQPINIVNEHDVVDALFFPDGSGFVQTFIDYSWIVNSYLFRTIDEGRSWELLGFPEAGRVLGFGLNNPQNIWVSYVLGSGDLISGFCLYHSTDGGMNWTKIQDDLISWPRTILVIDDNTVIIECFNVRRSWNRYLIKTTNGGLTWAEKYSIYGSDINKLIQIDDEKVLGVGFSGRVLISTDKGETWNDISINTNAYLRDVVYNQSNIYVLADSSYIFKSSDMGRSWENIFHDNFKVSSMAIKPNGEFWISGEQRKLYKSTNEGLSWSLTNSFLQDNLNSVYFSDRKNGIIVGEKGTMLSTNNYGLDWYRLNFPYEENLQDSYFDGEKVILVISLSGKIFKTTDKGLTWEVKYQQDGIVLKKISKVHQNLLIAAGDSGIVLTSTDFGETWSQLDRNNFVAQKFTGMSIPSSDFVSIGFGNFIYTSRDTTRTWSIFPNYSWKGQICTFTFVNPQIAYMLINYQNNQPLIINTKDGGNTWQSKRIFEFDVNSPSKINFLDSLNGFLIGNSLVITTNGGLSWSIDKNFYGKDIFMVDIHYGCIVGDYGTIIMKVPDDINPAISNVPTSFYLYQNYPNPFNQGTNILIDVNEESFITLKIYNTLGEEVATLIEEYLIPQRYIVYWNPTNLPSGVYYSCLQNKNKIIARKMVLIK